MQSINIDGNNSQLAYKKDSAASLQEQELNCIYEDIQRDKSKSSNEKT